MPSRFDVASDARENRQPARDPFVTRRQTAASEIARDAAVVAWPLPRSTAPSRSVREVIVSLIRVHQIDCDSAASFSRLIGSGRSGNFSFRKAGITFKRNYSIREFQIYISQSRVAQPFLAACNLFSCVCASSFSILGIIGSIPRFVIGLFEQSASRSWEALFK